ncbi:MAG: DUF2911 domain-containing protein [Acidobacteriaceae bacterium]|nr:DUF2911 domain-containing protein [Acidobacteriaceae bacterium]MBV9779536.1 DUF2911 domain-containing protein [Acidobacteriaceae bacterium]
MTRRTAHILTAVSPLIALTLWAQGQNRVSPHETVSVDLDGKKISITYGRPSLKGRHVGEEVAPYGKVWRLGADEATKISVNANTTISDASVELLPGSYALFAIPGQNKWTMIVNKVADQWGAFKYDQSQDLGRFDLNVKQLASPVEQFTIKLDKEGNNTARLTLEWDKASVSTTLKVQ